MGCINDDWWLNRFATNDGDIPINQTEIGKLALTGRVRITKIHLATLSVRSKKVVVACGHAIHPQFTTTSASEITCEMCSQIEKRGNDRTDCRPEIRIFVGDIWRSRDENRDVQVQEVFSVLGVPRTVKVKTIRAPLGVGKMYSWRATVFDGNRYRLVDSARVDTNRLCEVDQSSDKTI